MSEEFGALDLSAMSIDDLIEVVLDLDEFSSSLRDSGAMAQTKAAIDERHASLEPLRLKAGVEESLSELRMRYAERLTMGGGVGALALGLSVIISSQVPLIALFPVLIGAILLMYGANQAAVQVRRAAICGEIVRKIDTILGG